MSLTNELRSAKSWVNQFFKARIPHVVECALQGRRGEVHGDCGAQWFG